MGALNCGILKSLWPGLVSFGVRGREKSTGAVSGALA
jgi:hypothetical protein